MVVMTGSIVATKFVHPGDTVRFSIDGIGDVRLNIA
jgi:2-keto-4-pentenoate hydratase/2-oxohepta-3-ene-1,7-dioic acid hydratase in catechol pathway